MQEKKELKENKTYIFHLVHFEENDSIYVFFNECNLDCKGCIREKSPWDSHISNKARENLPEVEDVKNLNLNEFRKIIRSINPKNVILGGREPTVDPHILEIISFLEKEEIKTTLLTNGYLLTNKFTDKLIKNGLREVSFSIKALDNKIHKKYTSTSNEKILDNFQKISNKEIKLRSETVLIPKLIEIEEIEKIAKFISSVDKTIPLRIDRFKKVSTTGYQSATTDEVKKAVEIAKNHLETVTYINPNESAKGKVSVLYP